MKKLLVLFFAAQSLAPALNIVAGAIPDSLPELNQKILAFVNSKMKKKVGRGECWDLAAEALNGAGAKWNGKLKYGRLIDLSKEPMLAGDVIQFEGVKIKYEKDGYRFKNLLNHHTGVIHTVKGKKQFDMANQNTEEHGRKVGLSYIDLDQVASGRYFIYRPEK
jgi:hypothetical protein